MVLVVRVAAVMALPTASTTLLLSMAAALRGVDARLPAQGTMPAVQMGTACKATGDSVQAQVSVHLARRMQALLLVHCVLTLLTEPPASAPHHTALSVAIHGPARLAATAGAPGAELEAVGIGALWGEEGRRSLGPSRCSVQQGTNTSLSRYAHVVQLRQGSMRCATGIILGALWCSSISPPSSWCRSRCTPLGMSWHRMRCQSH